MPIPRRLALSPCLLLLAACSAAPAGPAVEGPGSRPDRAALPGGLGPERARRPRPLGITLTYLGVAGWALSDGARTVVVDPYFSRPALDGGVPVAVDEQAIARHAPAAVDLILVGHSHVDHVLDTPALARRTGAQVLGSVSTANYARAWGLPAAQVIPVKGGEDYAFDGLSVRVIPGLHSALDDKHLFGAGDLIPAGVALPMPMQGFGEGGTFNYLVRIGGAEVLFIGSANYIERELQGLRPDVAVVATGLRDELHDYAGRLMAALGQPPLVLTNHFDDWRAPLGTPLPARTRADLAAFAEEIRAAAPATEVRVPVALQPIEL